MMKKILELSTSESLFGPVEIKIDGKVYKSKPLSNQVIKKVLTKKLPRWAKKGNLDVLYSQVKLIYDIEDGVLKKLDVRDVGRIIKYTIEQITGSTEEGPEKNLSRPGDKK